MTQQSPHRRSEFSWLSRSRSRSMASLSSMTCVKGSYCSLLQLVAAYCGLLRDVAVCLSQRRAACCCLLPSFGGLMRLIAAYCSLLRSIVGGYCGSSRITLRSSKEAHPTPRVGLLRLVAAYILHIAASFRGMHEDFCGSLLRRLLIASCNILVIAAPCCGMHFACCRVLDGRPMQLPRPH